MIYAKSNAENLAEEWTSTLFQSVGDVSIAVRSLRQTPIPDASVEVRGIEDGPITLADVRDEVLSLSLQLRGAANANREVPVLIEPGSDTPVPVNLVKAVGAEAPDETDEFDRWLDQASEVVSELAEASSVTLAFRAPSDVMSFLRGSTADLVASRFAAAFTRGRVNLYPVCVHTTAANLRVHYSLNIAWSPVYFGAPSPTVRGKLQAARYQFGVDGVGMKLRRDPAVFDVPQTADAYLTVA